MSTVSIDGYTVTAAELAGLDLTRHDTRVHTIISVNVAFLVLVIFMVSLRTVVRLGFVRHFGWDDAIILIAGLFATALSAVVLSAIKFGLGHHVWDYSLATIIHNLKMTVKLSITCAILYSCAITATKASIIVTYLRIFPNPMFRKLMWATFGVVMAMCICSIFVPIFQCHPINGAWDFTLKTKPQCITYVTFAYAAAGVNIATDFILCTFPLPLFWRLNLALRERVVVCMLFALGFFATFASIMRLTRLHNIKSEDLPYVIVPSLDWSVVEVGTGILCASVPSIKPLLGRLWPGRFFRASRRGTVSHARMSSSNDGNHSAGSQAKAEMFSFNSTTSGSRMETGSIIRPDPSEKEGLEMMEQHSTPHSPMIDHSDSTHFLTRSDYSYTVHGGTPHSPDIEDPFEDGRGRPSTKKSFGTLHYHSTQRTRDRTPIEVNVSNDFRVESLDLPRSSGHMQATVGNDLV